MSFINAGDFLNFLGAFVWFKQKWIIFQPNQWPIFSLVDWLIFISFSYYDFMCDSDSDA